MREQGSAKLVLNREQHGIGKNQISPKALSVVDRLQRARYQAYLVGGCVRDLLCGKTPKDFDVSTNATPEQVRRVFQNSRIIGRRFRIVHVVFGSEIIEVTTFRGGSDNGQSRRVSSDTGMLVRDNVFGKDITEDAQRRDFTINAIYYDARSETLLDFHGGLYDLRHGVIDIIGDPQLRYHEDPVRIIRALRFSAKLGFKLSKRTADPIANASENLQEVSNARMFEEINKLFLTGHGLQSFEILRRFKIFGVLFPGLRGFLKNQVFCDFVEYALKSSDERFRQDRRNTPHFLFAVLLWFRFRERFFELARVNECAANPRSLRELANGVFSEVRQEQTVMTELPLMVSENIRSLWIKQFMLARTDDEDMVRKLASSNMFRASFDFLKLRARFEPYLEESVAFWQPYYDESARGARARRASASLREDRRSPAPGDRGFGEETGAEENRRLERARAWRKAMHLDP